MSQPVAAYSVGKVAALAGVSVRTLHHYDEIGLLSPGDRTAVGYRRYGEDDLERLQQILFYRELGFALEEIAAILDDPRVDAAAHLRRQHTLLTRRVERLQAMVAAVEHAMEAQQMGLSLTPEERLEVFGDFDPEEHAEEAERRWGGTEAHQQSQRRAASYTKEDWQQIKAGETDLRQRMAAAMRAGAEPGSERAMDLAEEHRGNITRWFYDCTAEIHRGLGGIYVGDPRFTVHYEQVAPGLAQWLRDAIHANADRQE